MSDARDLCRLELLPKELHVSILAYLAKYSETDLRNAMSSTPLLGLAASEPHIYKELNLQAHTVSPLLSIDRFHNLMDRCLASGNVQAHYVRGIQEYFRNENPIDGMYHLRLSADGSYADGVYLYGIIMMCRGEQAVGRAYLDMLGWKESPTKLDGCWMRIKTSLHGIAVARPPIYMATYQETRATIKCHRNKIGRRCELCFYFKQMHKFIYMI